MIQAQAAASAYRDRAGLSFRVRMGDLGRLPRLVE
jgi:hypothetical protein